MSRPKKWSEREDEVLDAVRAFAAQLGHAPSSQEWRNAPGSPALSTLLRMFPSWDAVLTSAGLPPLGNRDKYRPLSAERRAAEDEIAREANELIESGATYAAAGVPFGWDHNEVRRRVKRYRQAQGLGPLPARVTRGMTLLEIEAMQLADPSRDPKED